MRTSVAFTLALTGCSTCAPPAPHGSPASPTSFHIDGSHDSARTKALFEARDCQGGGVTWAGLVYELALAHGPLVEDEAPGESYTGVVYRQGATTLAIDDGAQGVLVQSDSPTLLAALKAEAAALDSDGEALRRALDHADPLAVECFRTADGGVVSLPKPLPSPDEVAAARASIARVVALIAREPAWCFPPHDVDGMSGVLRLLPDGSATLTDRKGKVAKGTWSKPRGIAPDTRIEVDVNGALVHLDADSGALGFAHSADGKVAREDLVAGSNCIH